MAREILRLEPSFPARSASRAAGDRLPIPPSHNPVPGLRARPQDAFPFGTDPRHYDVGQNVRWGIPPYLHRRAAVSNSPARDNRPFVNPSTHFCGRSRGNASERKTAKGRPPMAAMSLRPRVRQRRPTTSGAMPRPPEVNAFQGKVGCHQHFVPGRRLQVNRAVIANTDFTTAPFPASCGPCEGRAISAFSGRGMAITLSTRFLGLIYLLCEACAGRHVALGAKWVPSQPA